MGSYRDSQLKGHMSGGAPVDIEQASRATCGPLQGWVAKAAHRPRDTGKMGVGWGGKGHTSRDAPIEGQVAADIHL